MHGYQIIREIEQRSEGAWKPSAGSVYPTLQLLADEGLLTVEEDAGRKTYSLTDEGRTEAKRLQDSSRRAPWEFSSGPDLGRLGSVPKAGALLGQAGTTDQVERAVAVLDEARRRIHEILAEDSDGPEAG
jgi:DNA-binding PadR family transcriptional regulator